METPGASFRVQANGEPRTQTHATTGAAHDEVGKPAEYEQGYEKYWKQDNERANLSRKDHTQNKEQERRKHRPGGHAPPAQQVFTNGHLRPNEPS